MRKGLASPSDPVLAARCAAVPPLGIAAAAATPGWRRRRLAAPPPGLLRLLATVHLLGLRRWGEHVGASEPPPHLLPRPDAWPACRHRRRACVHATRPARDAAEQASGPASLKAGPFLTDGRAAPRWPGRAETRCRRGWRPVIAHLVHGSCRGSGAQVCEWGRDGAGSTGAWGCYRSSCRVEGRVYQLGDQQRGAALLGHGDDAPCSLPATRLPKGERPTLLAFDLIRPAAVPQATCASGSKRPIRERRDPWLTGFRRGRSGPALQRRA